MNDEQPQQPPKISMPKRVQYLVTVYVDKGEVEIRGPIHQKLFAIKALTDAIKIIVDYNPKLPSAIIDPRKNGDGRFSLP